MENALKSEADTSDAAQSAAIIRAHNSLGPIETAILLGRGFHGLIDMAENPISIAYSDLPGFP